MNTKVRQELEALIDEKYKNFSSKLLPGTNNILGVRLPDLRKIAKRIAKNNFEEFLLQNVSSFEETMLQGMVIGYINADNKTRIKFIKNFLPKINNWSICDSFCVGLKFTKTNKEFVWNFIQNYFFSKNEFEARFALVMCLNYFIEETYLQKIFEILPKIKLDKKYTTMAEGWLLSFCYKKFPQETTEFLSKNLISKEVKAITDQKIKELK